MPDTFCTLYNLQTLLLRECQELTQLSNSIGNLRHLRYLDLSCTRIKMVPNTLCSLYNLHMLLLYKCRKRQSLPSKIGSLLPHLDIEFCTALEGMPEEICEMKDLRTLTTFVIGNDGDWSIVEKLGQFQNIHGKFCTSSPENVVDVGDIWKLVLKEKKYINELSSMWNGETDDSKKRKRDT